MKKILFSLFTVIVLSAYFVTAAGAEDKKQPETETETKTLLMEAETGKVIKESGGYDKVPQGTMNKLMTVLLTAEEIESGSLSVDSVLTAGSRASVQEGAVVWLTEGEKITVDELLKAVIIGNANDGSMVLAEEIGGTEEDFVDMMNARAFELGMRNTVFKNPAGYDRSGQYSTAYDIGLLCRELLKHEFLYEYMTTWIDRIRGDQTEIVNENKLVRTYDGLLGLKASHSERSGYCLALAAEKGGKRYISVVMGCTDKDERFSIGKTLLGEGFSYYKVTIPSFSGEFIRPAVVKGGVEKAVEITAEHLEGLVVPENGGEISTVIFVPEYIDAPVKKGQKIGCIGFYNGDTLLYETYLITKEKVEKMSFLSSLNNFLHNLYK